MEQTNVARLRKLREDLGLTQNQLAVRLLVSQGTLSRWETGDRPVTARDLKAWGMALGRIRSRRKRSA